MPDDVSAESVAYAEMKRTGRWDLLHDLLGGTATMQSAGEKWLPKENDEHAKNYEARRDRSYLFNAYEDTVEKCVSKPFSKAVKVENIHDDLAGLASDVDGTGKDITQFMREVGRAAATYGLTHILIDHTVVRPRQDGKPLSKQDVKDLGARPVWIHITPPSLFAWRTVQPREGGVPQLDEVRFRIETIERDGAYQERQVERIVRYTREQVEYYKAEAKSNAYIMDGEARVNSLGRVPLVTVYFDQSGYLTAKPPLRKLADVNLAHWQSSSDQRTILHYSRIPILFLAGFEKKAVENGLTIGPTQALVTKNPDAKAEFVEHTGAAIKSGEDDLRALEARMEVLGAQPFINRAGVGRKTATGDSINEAKTQSLIQAWVRDLEAGAFSAYRLSAEWRGTTLPDGAAVVIYSDFVASLSGNDDVKELGSARRKSPPDITQKTYLRELKRRDILSETVDVDTEITDTADEGLSLSERSDGGDDE